MMTDSKETSQKKDHYQVSFLPWAGWGNEMQVGPIVFAPFNAQTQKKIKDQAVLDHLKKYFRCYVDHTGKPVDSTRICSHDNFEFKCLTDTQLTDLRRAVDVLLFCVIAPQIKNAVRANNKSMGPSSAEMFQLITQNFIPGNDHMAVRAGSCLHGGWQIGEITFPKPWSSGGILGIPDAELLAGFNKVFEPVFPHDIRERLFRSLEWFRLSHVENDDVSPLTKVIMMATAFEILLQVPNVPNKKKWIADEIEKKIATDDFLRETKKDSKGKGQTYSRAAWWMWDFYELRNCIVHGDQIQPARLRYQAPDRNWLTHLIVADIVFWEYVLKELFDQKCIGDKVRSCAKRWDDAFPDEPKGTSEDLLAQWFLGFSEIHRALGWQESKLKDEHLSKTIN